MKKYIIIIPLLILFGRIAGQDINTGKKYYYYKRYVSAERYFHDYLNRQPESAEGWLWLIKSYAQQNRSQGIYDTMSNASLPVRDDPSFLVAKGIQALFNSATDSAMIYFGQAIDKTKGRDPEVLLSIADAQLLVADGDLDYSLDLLTKALKKDKNNSNLYVTMGNVYLAKHNGTEAFKAYRNAIAKNEQNAEAYYQMGIVFLSQKNPDVYLDYFKKAVAADNKYAPAWYELYNHYRYSDPLTAMNYFIEYSKYSDKTINHDYAYTDLLYLSKDYAKAISSAKDIVKKEGVNIQPRIYKLLAYSYAELKDTTSAIFYMQDYFRSGNDTNFLVKDFETMADLFSFQPGMEDSVTAYLRRAVDVTADSSDKRKYYKKLAVLSNARKDYLSESQWRGSYYANNSEAKNVDLFYWGLASYRAEKYKQADSIFGLYTENYPDQGFGFYWRARSNAAIDTLLTSGLAIPHYQKLIATISTDTASANNKKWLLEAYTYLAAWETNTEKDYKEAIGYFDKILEIDPENNSAKKYIEILEGNLKKEEAAN